MDERLCFMTHHDAVDEWSEVAQLFISKSGDEMDETTTSLILLKGCGEGSDATLCVQRERMSVLTSIGLLWLKVQMSTPSTCHSPHSAFATDRYLVVLHEPCSRCKRVYFPNGSSRSLAGQWLRRQERPQDQQQPLPKKDRCAGKD